MRNKFCTNAQVSLLKIGHGTHSRRKYDGLIAVICSLDKAGKGTVLMDYYLKFYFKNPDSLKYTHKYVCVLITLHGLMLFTHS
jgi:hypothetical protein